MEVGPELKGEGSKQNRRGDKGVKRVSLLPVPHCPSSGTLWYTSTSTRSCWEVFASIFINFDILIWKFMLDTFLICGHI